MQLFNTSSMPDTKHNILRQLGAFACCISVRKSPIIDWIAGACIFCVYVSSLNRSRGPSPVQSSPFSGLSQPKYPRNQLTRSRLIKYISFIIWQLGPGKGGGWLSLLPQMALYNWAIAQQQTEILSNRGPTIRLDVQCQ